MNIGKVVGSVVCTVKTPTLEGIKLLVVRQIVNGRKRGSLSPATARARQVSGMWCT